MHNISRSKSKYLSWYNSQGNFILISFEIEVVVDLSSFQLSQREIYKMPLTLVFMYVILLHQSILQALMLAFFF